MQPHIHEAIVTPRYRGGRNASRIRRHPGNAKLHQHRFDFRRKPGLVPGLENDVPVVTIPQLVEESMSDFLVKRQTRRDLHQDGPALGAKSGDLREKSFDGWPCINQSRFVCHGFGELDGETKGIRYRGGPALIRTEAVRTIEAGVDLDGVENARVPLEMSPALREFVAVLATNAPSGYAEVDLGGQ